MLYSIDHVITYAESSFNLKVSLHQQQLQLPKANFKYPSVYNNTLKIQNNALS